METNGYQPIHWRRSFWDPLTGIPKELEVETVTQIAFLQVGENGNRELVRKCAEKSLAARSVCGAVIGRGIALGLLFVAGIV
ncbi:MAG: hypothetical protein LBB38_03395, partial [Puniceicoccales bacterium]|nr:hypothetical protein [Puniceicoccales bacterium]